MDDVEGDLASGETSDTELDDFELDLEDNFEDDLDSDEGDTPDSAHPTSGPLRTGNTALIGLGNVHPFHSCSSCGSLEIDRRNSSQFYIWAKLPVHPSQAPDECEFFRFGKEQYSHFPDSASLYMGIELNNGRPTFGCRVVFTFTPSPKVWTQRNFFAGRIHPSELDKTHVYGPFLT
jgi:hypothetical protein